jgi:hypothetical protein
VHLVLLQTHFFNIYTSSHTTLQIHARTPSLLTFLLKVALEGWDEVATSTGETLRAVTGTDDLK